MIELRNATRRFGDVRALDGISLTVPCGAVYGLVGPNGAGKTTCLNVLATLEKLDDGELYIDGKLAQGNLRTLRRRIGYVPDFFGTMKSVTVDEYLRIFATACGIAGLTRTRRIAQVLQICGLTDLRETAVDTLSRGMKQRLCLAKALVHEPDVLILDEPASGLDPRARNGLRNVIRRIGRSGATIVISSHILSELDGLCSHLALLDNGRLLRAGRADELIRAARSRLRWIIRYSGKPGNALTTLRQLPYVTAVQTAGEHELHVTLEEAELKKHHQSPDECPADILAALGQAGVNIRSLELEHARLEQALLSLMESNRFAGPEK